MRLNNRYTLLITSFVLPILLACNALAIPDSTPEPVSSDTPSPVLPTETIQPTPTSAVLELTPTIIPTATPLPLSQQVTLISSPFNETNQSPPYTIASQTPQLVGSDDPRVQAFNQRLSGLVAKELNTFRESFLQNTGPPVSSGSFLEVTYTLISQFDNVWSFKFDFHFYSDGAAHPGLYSITINYDLGQGRELALADLFIPHANYLEVISNYCITELSKQPFYDGAFTDGADPTLENYRNWNIAPDGLMITFDEYQVAPYAAGPQVVTVPYSALQAVINPQGPLGSISQ